MQLEVSRMTSRKRCSTMRSDGRYSGKPLIGASASVGCVTRASPSGRGWCAARGPWWWPGSGRAARAWCRAAAGRRRAGCAASPRGRPGQVGASDGAGEEDVARHHRAVDVDLVGDAVGHPVEAEHHRALGVPGRVQHVDVHAGEGQHVPSVISTTLSARSTWPPRRTAAPASRQTRVAAPRAGRAAGSGRRCGCRRPCRLRRPESRSRRGRRGRGSAGPPPGRSRCSVSTSRSVSHDADARVDDEALLARLRRRGRSSSCRRPGPGMRRQHAGSLALRACVGWGRRSATRRAPGDQEAGTGPGASSLGEQQATSPGAGRPFPAHARRRDRRRPSWPSWASSRASADVLPRGARPSPADLAGCDIPPTAPGTAAELAAGQGHRQRGDLLATLTTNCGDIVLDLDGAKAPQAVASFIQLARATTGSTPRATASGVGDAQRPPVRGPDGTGQGNPGYGFGVENAPKDGKYPAAPWPWLGPRTPIRATGPVLPRSRRDEPARP